MKLLLDAMAPFLDDSYIGTRAWNMRYSDVIDEHYSAGSRFDAPWIGKEKNVTYWVELRNGYAVGMNENPARGISFPVKRINRTEAANG